MDEEEIKVLIKEASADNLNAFDRLIQLCASLVTNTIYQHIGPRANEADDLAQEVFLKLYNKIKYFRQESRFSTWLYRVTINTIYDHLRRMKCRQTTSIDDIENNDPATCSRRAAEYGKEELNRIIGNLIQELPIKYRTVIILKDIEELSYKDISCVIGRSIGTVESRLFRARSLLRNKIKTHPAAKELI